jgi:hypothetical protein
MTRDLESIREQVDVELNKRGAKYIGSKIISED